MRKQKRRIAMGWLPALLATATLAGNSDRLGRLAINAEYLRGTWSGRGYRSAGDHVDLPRNMVERHVAPCSDVYFAHGGDGGLRPVDRSRQIAVSWALCPNPVRYGGADDIGCADAVLITASGSGPDFAAAGLDPGDFEKVEEGGGLALWMKKERPPPQDTPAATPSLVRELAGLTAPAFVIAASAVAAGWTGALLGLLLFSTMMTFPPLAGFSPSPLFVVAVSALCPAAVCLFRPWLRRGIADTAGGGRGRFLNFAMAAGLLFGIIAGTLALSHTFVAPNGLGVSGGRAKLMYAAGGIPLGFFTDRARRTLQPVYPPGQAMITLGCYGLAGGCGEWLTQLVGVTAGALVFVWLGFHAATLPARLWVLAVMISPLALRMGSLYYSETFVALFTLVGWERLSKDSGDPAGWLLAGAAGWFKNEGLVYLLAIWLILNFRGLWRIAGWRNLALAAALPAAWHIWCRSHGATLDDFGALLRPDIFQAWAAVVRMCKYAFAEPWLYGFAFPAALVALMFPACRSPGLKQTVAVSGLCVISLAFIFAISESPYLDWQFKSLERLLWVPSLLLVREVAYLFLKKQRMSRVSTAHG